MTTDLQRAMARYEDARIAYRKVVLASLHDGSTGGEAIREAILRFKAASAELKRLQAAPPPVPAVEPATAEGTGWWRRLLKAS